MLKIQFIESLDDPRLGPYRTLRRPMDHRQQNIFVAEGSLVVQRLLESDLPVLSLLLTEEWLRRVEPLLQARSGSIDVCVVPKELIEQTTGFSCHQGLKAVGKIPTLPTMESVVQGSPHPQLFAAVDSLANAENVGTLVRNCTAFGVQALFVGETSSSPYLTRAVRCSMGTVFKLAVVEVANLTQTLRDLRARGVRCVAAHPTEERNRLSQTDLSGDCCLVFGNEGNGLSAAVLEACDAAAAIPMQTAVDSLNVGCASAAFLYEANRQRGKA